MIKVILDPTEIATCNLVGSLRSIIARGWSVNDAKIGGQDGVQADVMGFMAEYAFAKQFNVCVDLGFSPRSGSADGVLKGMRYDIKSTTYMSGKLLATLKVNPDVDIYVLSIVKPPIIMFPGWAYKKDLIKEENIKDLGHGKGYCLEQEQLTPFKDK